MTKKRSLQVILYVIPSLIIGIIIGSILDIPGTRLDEISGSIGNVDRTFHLQSSNQDLQLRNELIEKQGKRQQYEKYLTYCYYQTVRTARDIEEALAKTATVGSFSDIHDAYADGLGSYLNFLASARVDILKAVNILNTLGKSSDVPPITVALRNANNAIARISTQNSGIIEFQDAIAGFIGSHPDETYKELKDAHDILSLNLIHAAAFRNDKPTLLYFEQQNLYNSPDEIAGIISHIGEGIDIREEIGADIAQINPDGQEIISIDNIISGIEGSGILGDQDNIASIIISGEKGSIIDGQRIGEISRSEDIAGISDDIRRF